MTTIESVVEIAHLAGALPELLETIPAALEYGLSTFYRNWDIMIQDIYDLNPDVTLYKFYNDNEFVLINGIMSATSENTFSPDSALKVGYFNQAMNVIIGTDLTTDDNSEVSSFKFRFHFFQPV